VASTRATRKVTAQDGFDWGHPVVLDRNSSTVTLVCWLAHFLAFQLSSPARIGLTVHLPDQTWTTGAPNRVRVADRVHETTDQDD
jgi:hypothetical protein